MPTNCSKLNLHLTGTLPSSRLKVWAQPVRHNQLNHAQLIPSNQVWLKPITEPPGPAYNDYVPNEA